MKIAGTFSGVSGDTVYLELITTKERKLVDSTVTDKKGGFKFAAKLPSSNPTFFNLICKQNTIPLLLSPGERITLKSIGDLSQNYEVTGSTDTKLLQNFNRLFQQGMTALDSLSNQYAQTPPTLENEARRKELITEYSRRYYKLKRDHIAFLVENANSMVAVYALYQRLPGDESLSSPTEDLIYYRMVADSLSKSYPESSHVQVLIKEVADREKNMEAMVKINDQLNNPISFPSLDLPDMYGKRQNLSSLLGQVILIDFWAPEDTRANVINAELKDTYAAYADKGFQVYQVAVSGTKVVWVNAVQSQKLPWISVVDAQGIDGMAARSYNVQGVPWNVLIDKQGNIVGSNYYGERLRAKLTELTR